MARLRRAARHADRDRDNKDRPDMEHLQLRVAKIWSQAGGIKGFELISPSGEALPPFSAGAHVLVHLPNGLVRQYSMCNDPGETHRYEIGVLRAPEGRGGSAFMHEGVKPGDLLTIDLPRNNFELKEDAATYILTAGGIGVTPLLAMAHRLNRLGKNYRLYYCTRAKEMTAYLERLSGTDFAERVTFVHDGGDQFLGLRVVNEPRLDRGEDLDEPFDRHVVLRRQRGVRGKGLFQQLLGEAAERLQRRPRAVDEQVTGVELFPPLIIRHRRIDVDGSHDEPSYTAFSSDATPSCFRLRAISSV